MSCSQVTRQNGRILPPQILQAWFQKRTAVYRKLRWLKCLATVVGIQFFSVSLCGGAVGYDTGWSAEKAAKFVQAMPAISNPPQWLRLRGMGASAIPGNSEFLLDSSTADQLSDVTHARRTALGVLRQHGFNTVSLIRWSRSSWKSPTRTTSGRIPIDLREAYHRSFLLAQTLGDLIDGWEIDNEPDIGFVVENPESFAAFYKACALGLLHGRRANMMAKDQEPGGTNHPGLADTIKDRAASLVVHAPLALPPGPYWLELSRNNTPAYTEGFNYHFYGYPEDFAGVRDAWIAAFENVAASSVPSSPFVATMAQQSQPVTSEKIASPRRRSQTDGNISPQRSPIRPLFLTEYGYGLLDRYDQLTEAGRARQKHFFEETLPYVSDGLITGAMAFQLAPWLGPASHNEFGLLAELPSTQSRRKLTRGSINSKPIEPTNEARRLVSLKSEKLAKSSIAPEQLSPVVIDFIASRDWQSVKRYRGHLMKSYTKGAPRNGDPPDTSQNSIFEASSSPMGDFSLVLYNFSDRSVTGTLAVSIEDGDVVKKVPAPTSAASANRSGDSAVSRPTALTERLPSKSSLTSRKKIIPYERPNPTRPSRRPPLAADWPRTDTKAVVVDFDLAFAISPALELLWRAESVKPPLPSRSKERPISSTFTGIPQPDTDLADRDRAISTTVTLGPMERLELPWSAILHLVEFRGHRLKVEWLDGLGLLSTSEKPRGGNQLEQTASNLTTLLFPPPSAFSMYDAEMDVGYSGFSFSAQGTAARRTTQVDRLKALDESQLFQNSDAHRWLSTPGVEIQETDTGWTVTVNDFPVAPLRPAEIELVLPADWQILPCSALSFTYKLVGEPTKEATISPTRATIECDALNRFEEFDVNFRDGNGTLWSVWPRLLATHQPQSYLEPLTNFTPMFFSRAQSAPVQYALPFGGEALRSLVVMLRPRQLPATFQISGPRMIQFRPTPNL